MNENKEANKMALERWSPRQESRWLRDMMDEMFDERMMRPPWRGRTGHGWPVPMDMTETDKSLVLRADVPGMDRDNIEITIRGNTLTISGKYETEKKEENEDVYFRERRAGSFRRSISLPADVDEEHITAEMDNGVLTVTLPKTAEQQKRIPVQVKQG
jgi:HSP20 family protein